MVIRESRRKWASLCVCAVASLWIAFIGGCDRIHSEIDLSQGSSSEGAKSGEATEEASMVANPRLQQTFAEATRPDPPADWQRPPDTTMTGKSVGKLYSEVVAKWDSYRFVNSSGQPLKCTATLETELGPVEIALRPDLAPNHVRNFIALAQVGYYDGLVFERTVHARSEEQPDAEVELIEGGCPLGTGDMGVGSLGYWLKPEFSKEPHETGTVGACHGLEPDTAACRFYITLNKAPFLDGNFTIFGKVTRGMEVARKIFALPVRNDSEYPEGDRPQTPVVINKVTISISEPGHSAAN
jgi:peptidyl-prolyl cis-trans isomerase B (cyclophilin B)